MSVFFGVLDFIKKIFMTMAMIVLATIAFAIVGFFYGLTVCWIED